MDGDSLPPLPPPKKSIHYDNDSLNEKLGIVRTKPLPTPKATVPDKNHDKPKLLCPTDEQLSLSQHDVGDQAKVAFSRSETLGDVLDDYTDLAVRSDSPVTVVMENMSRISVAVVPNGPSVTPPQNSSKVNTKTVMASQTIMQTKPELSSKPINVKPELKTKPADLKSEPITRPSDIKPEPNTRPNNLSITYATKFTTEKSLNRVTKFENDLQPTEGPPVPLTLVQQPATHSSDNRLTSSASSMHSTSDEDSSVMASPLAEQIQPPWIPQTKPNTVKKLGSEYAAVGASISAILVQSKSKKLPPTLKTPPVSNILISPTMLQTLESSVEDVHKKQEFDDSMLNDNKLCESKVKSILSPKLPRSFKLHHKDDSSEISDDIGCGESDDGLSDGGEFYEYNPSEFALPSFQVLLKSIPIVTTQQHTVREKKGTLFKYTSTSGKISSLGSQWQKRWVTVDTTSLKYFSSNKSYVSKRVIPVSTMMNVEQDIKVNEVHPFRFRLTTVDRVYRFAMDNADDLALWTSLLMRAIIDAKQENVSFEEGGDMNKPNMEGYSRMADVRSRRYLAIKQGKFCFYNTRNDFKGFCPIHEVSLQLANVKDVGKCRIQLLTPQVSFVFIFETQEEVNAWKAAFEGGISYALGDDKVMDEVYECPSNNVCADCSLPGPEWAAVNMGITLCQNCAGVHRTLPNAKIRSLRMDSKIWKPSLIEMMKAIGNNNANSFWEWSVESDDKLDSDADMPIRRQYILSKYRDKRWCQLHSLHEHQSELNDALCKAVQQIDIMETVQLVFSGADIFCTSMNIGDDNNTPYHLAELAKQPMQMEFLFQNGADFPQVNSTNTTHQ